MYTAIVVYHAPQMKNWRNIITDSLVRITALACRYREILRQTNDDMRPRWQDDVRVLGGRCDAGARDAADHAADDRPLPVAADHPAEYRAGDCAGTDLGRVARRDPASFVRGLDRVDGALDRVRIAPYGDARNAQRQGPRGARIWRRFYVRDR